MTVIAGQEHRGAGRNLRGVEDSFDLRIGLGDLLEGRARRCATRFRGGASDTIRASGRLGLRSGPDVLTQHAAPMPHRPGVVAARPASGLPTHCVTDPRVRRLAPALGVEMECKPDRDETVIRGAGGSCDAFFRIIDATLHKTHGPD
jgi:hypothetical protein